LAGISTLLPFCSVLIQNASMEEEIVIIVRPMRIVRAFAAFFCGVLAGWLVIACFMMVHDGVDIGGVLRLVTLWLPVAAVYSVVIVAASHRLLARFAPTLLLLLGCVVGLLPFLGYWPPYFPDFRPLILGVHLVAVAIAGSAWVLVVLLVTRLGLKRVVPVAVGLAAGMAVGFFLGAMVTRHNEPIVVIHNATDETLRSVFFQTDFHTSLDGIPGGEAYGVSELQPHHTFPMRLSSHRSTALKLNAVTAGGKKLSSEEVYVASQGLLFALVSSDGITLQYERFFGPPPSLFGPVLTLVFCLMVCAVGGFLAWRSVRRRRVSA
jgi:hypothetical protein